jgi:hypothetical protein
MSLQLADVVGASGPMATLVDTGCAGSMGGSEQLTVIESSGPHEYLNVLFVWPQMCCEANAGD